MFCVGGGVWFEAQPDLEPKRLVFIDETGASTKMARRYGRSPRGERCRAPVPHGHWKTTTFVGALRAGGDNRAHDPRRRHARRRLPGLCGAGPRADAFAPETSSSWIICPRHKPLAVRHAIEATGADLHFLPPYFSRLQSHRDGLFKAQGLPQKDRRPNRRRSLRRHRTRYRDLHIKRMPKTTSPPQDMTANDRKTL